MPLGTLSTERHGGTPAAGVSLMEVSTFMTEQLKAVARMEARVDKQAAEAKAEMEMQRLENDKLRGEVNAKLLAEASLRAEMQAQLDGAAAARLRDQQLVALQARLEALGAAKLLTDDEMFAVEDIIGDSSGEASEDGQVTTLLALSTRMASNSGFARQVRRKFVQ
jgi:hypothetical protein